MMKHLFSVTLFNTLGYGLGFLVQLLMARLMPVEEYGLFNIFFSINAVLSLFALMGFPHALTRLIPNFKRQKQTAGLWWMTLTLSCSAAMILGGITYLLLHALALPGTPPEPLYLWAFITLIPLVILKLQSGFFKAREKPYTALNYEIVTREGLLLVGLIICALYGVYFDALSVFQLYAITLGHLSLIALAHGFSHIKSLPPIKQIKTNGKEWISMALPMMFTVFALVLLQRTDIIMLGFMSSAEETGIYSLAARLSQIIGLPMMTIAAIFAPLASKLYAAKDKTALKALFNKHRLFLILTTAAASIALITAAPYSLPFFGEDYHSALWPLIILLTGHVIGALWGPIVLIMIMSEHENLTMKTTIGAALFNIALNAALIPWLGIIGAALATVISTNLKYATLSWYAQQHNLFGK